MIYQCFALIMLLASTALAQNQIEFLGTVERLPGRGLIGDWRVAGRTVHVLPATEINQGGAVIAVGATIAVKGRTLADGSVDARQIELKSQAQATTSGWTLLAWNDLGMHCMDADYSVFSILPPYNTIHAQLIRSGSLVRSSSGVTLTYEAVRDPAGSLNSTSSDKTNFWRFVLPLFGVTLPVDTGLATQKMPVSQPQPMKFDPALNWFTAEGIPITPYDDARNKNAYPMMRIVARDAAGARLASTDVVLPVSDEMDCRACHGSGSRSTAQPSAGWVWDSNPDLDYKLNILRLHDDRQAGKSTYNSALAAKRFSPMGLFETVKKSPILCAACHPSNALPGTGIAGVSPLTKAIHLHHADARDPLSNLTLESATNRDACYRCHPGAATKCLRGAMGNAIAPDGAQAIQCQNCHGSMRAVGADRVGWLDQPACQQCHTGTAVSNAGEIRYASVFDISGQRRFVADRTFATNPDTPAAGVSLYRFSKGHGDLQCEACHGSTHAEFPSGHANDNVQSMQLQGHAGVIAECSACHRVQPSTTNGGPHGLHPIGAVWVDRHERAAEGNGALQCRACHGADYRGSVLSRSQADRTITSEFGARLFWRGFQIGCYACHDGPRGENPTRNRPPVVGSVALSTNFNVPATTALPALDIDGNPLVLRVVSQPRHGRVLIATPSATFYPDADFFGADSFTYAAWDGYTDSNLGTVSITVRGPLGRLASVAHPGGREWVQGHRTVAKRAGTEACQGCHGQDLRGTEHSRTGTGRVILTRLGTREFWNGFQVGCFACHNGPGDLRPTPNRAPVARDSRIAATTRQPVKLALAATDADEQPLTYRIVSAPQHGQISLEGNAVRYIPADSFRGVDSFTYAAWDGYTNSNLGRVQIRTAAVRR